MSFPIIISTDTSFTRWASNVRSPDGMSVVCASLVPFVCAMEVSVVIQHLLLFLEERSMADASVRRSLDMCGNLRHDI